MIFNLIICTYRRSLALSNLLHSIKSQELYPNKILIIDASTDTKTEELINKNNYKNTYYYKVDNEHKGLTKQRNYGINLLDNEVEVVCFLDDDVILESEYFKKLIKTYYEYPLALGVGGYITNEVQWQRCDSNSSKNKFCLDGYCRDEPKRFKIRSLFGLQPDRPPGYQPTFSHGRSVSFLPPSNKVYKVEQFMGGVSSYKTEIFNSLKFSTYFEGYGLYEDADFCLRLSKLGPLYINSAARLGHFHDPSGRPNRFKYGKMIVRNGWYIWRVKYNNPPNKAVFKWYATEILLMLLTYIGALKGKEKLKTLREGNGRLVGLVQLIVSKPIIS